MSVAVVALGLSVATGSPAWAAPDEQRLELSSYVGAGDTVADSGSVNDSDSNRPYVGFQGNVTLESVRPRRTIAARVGGSVRYVQGTSEFFNQDQSASLGIDARLSARSRLSATQTIQYSRFRQFGPALFAPETVGELPTGNPETAATVGESFYDLGSALEWSRRLGQRSGLSLNYVAHLSLGVTTSDELPVSQRASISFRRTLGPYATLRLGTGYRFGRTGFESTALPTRAQDFDVGIEYNRPLSFARGMKLAFSTGSALVSRPATVSDPNEVGQQLIATGAVTATQPIGRYWAAQLGVDRNLQYVDGFPDPFYATRVLSRVSGRIRRRVDTLVEASYSSGGGISPGSAAQDFEGLQLQARLTYALARNWQLFAVHYRTENKLSPEAQSGLPPGFRLRPSQASFQVGFNLYVR